MTEEVASTATYKRHPSGNAFSGWVQLDLGQAAPPGFAAWCHAQPETVKMEQLRKAGYNYRLQLRTFPDYDSVLEAILRVIDGAGEHLGCTFEHNDQGTYTPPIAHWPQHPPGSLGALTLFGDPKSVVPPEALSSSLEFWRGEQQRPGSRTDLTAFFARPKQPSQANEANGTHHRNSRWPSLGMQLRRGLGNMGRLLHKP